MEDTQKLVEIVGYQETRYFRQIWHYQHHGSISSVEGSTLTLTQDKTETEGFAYRELFSNVHPTTNETIKVDKFCVITDFRRFSSIFVDFRRFSSIFVDF